MQTFLGVVLDSRPQVLKIPARAAAGAAPPHIVAAGFAGHLVQRLAAPIVVQPPNACLKLRPRRLSGTCVIEVDAQDVGDVDQLDVALLAGRLVFERDVFGELAFGFFNLVRKASRGEMLAAIDDEPGCPAAELSVLRRFWSKPEPSALGSTRHSCLIRSILAKVV